MTPPPPMMSPPPFEANEVLKADLFGRIERGVAQTEEGPQPAVRRHLAAAPLWLRPIARLLARREARALERLRDVPSVPHLLARTRSAHLRTWIGGEPINVARPTDPGYYAAALRLLRQVHAAGVTHNDTHKEPNWLMREDGSPALLDFQLASRFKKRTRWFRLLALEDVRHLLKHKKKYCPSALTARQKALLERRSWPARWWRRTIKPPYRWFTRKVLRWRDDEGRGMLR